MADELSTADELTRLGALERGAADQRLQLERLAAQQRALQHSHSALLAEHLALKEDHDVLCDGVGSAGVVGKSDLARLRRMRRSSAALRELLQAPELAAAVGAAAGLHTSLALTVASRTHGESLRCVLPALLAQMPRTLYACGGSTGSEELSVAERLVLREHGDSVELSPRWDPLPDLPTARRWCGAAQLRGMLYVIGGHSGIRYLDAVERFNTELGIWEAMPPMPTPREGCAVASAAGRLFVFGGSHGERALSTVEAFDSESLRWITPSDMPSPRDACAAAADHRGRCAFLAGGRDTGRFLDTADRFDLVTYEWTPLPPMPTPRLGCAAAFVAGGLYVAGGHGHGQALSALERYDVSEGRWDRLVPMPTARLGCAAVAIVGCLHVFGGHNGERALATVERFDPCTGCWSALPPLLSPRYACAAGSAL
eukprot:TRINITY_DN17587_c0_g1_i2.p1 TRINITY_DN17587_c0_g1~~TRINITY_DN17587_c0_g1_i2.p1  ORF type:complete len:483 (-),score=74.31 TRINITY_DN17587_c0_g1_i2:139-1422(-)